MEIYVLYTFITFKKHCIYKHFKPFYFSRLFIVGILPQFNLKWLISLYLAAFRYLYYINITPFNWLKPLNLSYSCRMAHKLSYPLSAPAGPFPKIHPICVLNFQSLPVSLHRWLPHKCPSWFQCWRVPLWTGSPLNLFHSRKTSNKRYASNDDMRNVVLAQAPGVAWKH